MPGLFAKTEDPNLARKAINRQPKADARTKETQNTEIMVLEGSNFVLHL